MRTIAESQYSIRETSEKLGRMVQTTQARVEEIDKTFKGEVGTIRCTMEDMSKNIGLLVTMAQGAPGSSKTGGGDGNKRKSAADDKAKDGQRRSGRSRSPRGEIGRQDEAEKIDDNLRETSGGGGAVPKFTLAETRLNSFLRRSGLHRVRIAGDGNCWYRTLEAGMRHLDPHVSPYDQIRERTVQFMRDNDDVYGKTWDAERGQGTFEQYLQRQATAGVWAQGYAIQASAEVLGCCFELYLSTQRIIRVTPSYPIPPHRLIRVAHIMNKHFDLAVTAEQLRDSTVMHTPARPRRTQPGGLVMRYPGNEAMQKESTRPRTQFRGSTAVSRTSTGSRTAPLASLVKKAKNMANELEGLVRRTTRAASVRTTRTRGTAATSWSRTATKSTGCSSKGSFGGLRRKTVQVAEDLAWLVKQAAPPLTSRTPGATTGDQNVDGCMETQEAEDDDGHQVCRTTRIEPRCNSSLKGLDAKAGTKRMHKRGQPFRRWDTNKFIKEQGIVDKYAQQLQPVGGRRAHSWHCVVGGCQLACRACGLRITATKEAMMSCKVCRGPETQQPAFPRVVIGKARRFMCRMSVTLAMLARNGCVPGAGGGEGRHELRWHGQALVCHSCDHFINFRGGIVRAQTVREFIRRGCIRKGDLRRATLARTAALCGGADLPDGPPTVMVLSANITAWSTGWQQAQQALKSRPGSIPIWLLQEVRLDEIQAARAATELTREGLAACWGPFVQKDRLGRSKAGGCAIVSLQTAQPKEAIDDTGHLDMARMVGEVAAAAVPLPGRRRHLWCVTFYLRPGTSTENRDLFFQHLLSFVEGLGHVPVLIAGDANAEIGNTGLLGCAVAGGDYVDIMDGQGTHVGRNGHARRIDLMIANRFADQLIGRTEVDRSSDLPRHKHLVCELFAGKYEDTKFSLVTPVPSKDTSMIDEQQFNEIWSRHADSFQEALDNDDVQRAWDEWCEAAQGALGERPTRDGRNRRGGPPVLREEPVIPPEWGGTGEPQAAARELHLLRLANRLGTLAGMAKAEVYDPMRRTTLERRIRGEIRRRGTQLPDALQGKAITGVTFFDGDLLAAARDEVRGIYVDRLRVEKRRRIKEWKEAMQESIERGGAKAFQWVRGPKEAMRRWMEDEESEDEELMEDPERPARSTFTHSPSEILDGIEKKLSAHYCRLDQDGEQERSWAQFRERFGQVIDGISGNDDFKLEDITAMQVVKAVGRWSKRPVAGTDGWVTEQWRRLPPVAFEPVAALLNAIERLQKWPVGAYYVRMALLPRPIGVAVLLYRCWSSIRARDLYPWLSHHFEPGVTGARKGHSTSKLINRALALIDRGRSTREATQVFGVKIDATKFFDRIAWEVPFEMMTTLGLPARIRGAWERHVRELVRVYSYAGAVKVATRRNTNGFLQGCALSVVVSSVIALMWEKIMRIEVFEKVENVGSPDLPSSGCGSFIDDRLVYAQNPAILQSALGVSDQYDDFVGATVSVEKTRGWTTAPRWPRIYIAGQRVQADRILEYLGANIDTQGDAIPPLLKKRLDKLDKRVRRIGCLPGGWRVKSRFLEAIVGGTLGYGPGIGREPKKRLITLRTGIRKALMGRKHVRGAPEIVHGVLLNAARTWPEIIVRLKAFRTHQELAIDLPTQLQRMHREYVEDTAIPGTFPFVYGSLLREYGFTWTEPMVVHDADGNGV
ncbi:MAG: hypothetical protein GY722_03910, partial [bacterium]|nr:hypothetical protein [bacterium]